MLRIMPPSITAARFDGPPTMRNEVRFVEAKEEPGGEPRLVLTWSVNPAATHVAFSVKRSPGLKEWQDEGGSSAGSPPGEYRDSVTINRDAPQCRSLRLKVSRQYKAA